MLRVCGLAATTFFLTLSSVTSALGHPLGGFNSLRSLRLNQEIQTF